MSHQDRVTANIRNVLAEGFARIIVERLAAFLKAELAPMNEAFPFDGEWMRCTKAPHPNFARFKGEVWWIGRPKERPGFVLAYPDHEYDDNRVRIKASRVHLYFTPISEPQT